MAKVFPYDIELNGKGYMLARQDQLGRGARSWNVEAQGYSNVSLTSEESRYASQPPQVETVMVWESFHRGYGDELQRAIGRYNYSENVDCRFPNQILPGPKLYAIYVGGSISLKPSKFIEHADKLFFTADRYVYEVNFATSEAVAVDDLGATHYAQDMDVFNDNLYVTGGTKPHKRDGSGTWTALTSEDWAHFCVANGQLYAQRYSTIDGLYSGNYIMGCVNDPDVAADWTAPYRVGDPATNITAMGAMGDLVYVGKTDGLHALDASGIGPILTPEMRPYRHDNNCVGMKAWHGAWYVPHLRGLLRYTDLGSSGFAVASVGPGRNVAENPIHGVVTAIAGDDRWLYIALYLGSNTSCILAGREATSEEEDSGPMVWHPILKTNRYINTMHITGLTTPPRLFFGYDLAIAYIILPQNIDNPRGDTGCRYATGGSLYLSAHDLQAPVTKKVFRSIEVQADNLSTTNYVTVYYKIDDAATWTSAGTIKAGPQGTLELSTTGVSGYKIGVRLDWTQGSDSLPVIVKRVAVKASERPDTVDVITATVRLSDNLPLRTAGTCPRTAAAMQAELLALAELAQSVTLRDPAGTSYKVLVQAPVTRQEAAQTGHDPLELVATVRMSVWSTS